MVLMLISFTFPYANAESVPDWVKNNAGWWATDAISEKEFVNAIEFLIKDGIIIVSDTKQNESRGDNIPEWIKNNAGWWATDAISEKEFVNAIEFLIKDGIISLEKTGCSENVDINKNNMPDEIENLPNLIGMELSEYTSMKKIFVDKDWSNCKMPFNLQLYLFQNVDLTNADMSNSNLAMTSFVKSDLTKTNFSNSNLHGSIFLYSDIEDTNFQNADFTPEPYEKPFVHFSLNNSVEENWTSVTFSCSWIPCTYQSLPITVETDPLSTLLFGEKKMPLNLKYVKEINDDSDRRIIYRQVSNFSFNNITNTNFSNSDLSHTSFGNNYLENIDFSSSDLSKSIFYYSTFENIIMKDQKPFSEVAEIEVIENKEEKNYVYPEIIPEVTDSKINDSHRITMENTIDEPPIYFSMGMLVQDDKLYVANTDDHEIQIFDKNNLELITDFTSPLQYPCATTNGFIDSTDCPYPSRNLPTSLSLLDEKIFVNYGFANNIQIFDLDGNFVKTFGSFGKEQGEFNTAFDLVSYNDELFVLDAGNFRIQVFDKTGNYLREFSTNIEENSNSLTKDLEIHDGTIFVLESMDSSILHFDLDGNFIKKIFFSDNPLPDSIIDMSFNGEYFFTANAEMHNISIYDLNGNFLINFGTNGQQFGQFDAPQDIVFDGEKIYVSDGYNHRIQIFNFFR